MDERWEGPESDGEYWSGRTGHWLSPCADTAQCHEPSDQSDQSDIMMISDQETASSVTWDDVSRPLTPHPAQPIISGQESEWLGRDGKLCSECTSVQCSPDMVHGWLPLVPCVHTLTLADIPRTQTLSWHHVSTSLQTDNAAVSPPAVPRSSKQCLFTLWLITLKFTAWVWTNRSEQLNGPCSHKWCLFWAQTTKERLKRVSDNSFKTFEVVMSEIIFDLSLLLPRFGCYLSF